MAQPTQNTIKTAINVERNYKCQFMNIKMLVVALTVVKQNQDVCVMSVNVQNAAITVSFIDTAKFHTIKKEKWIQT